MSTASCSSEITFIDGEKGLLLYRGYPIEQLAEHYDFLDVAAKAMGEFRDACMLESQLRDHFAQVGFVQTAPTQIPLQLISSEQPQLSPIVSAPAPLSEIIPPLEMLRIQVSHTALAAATESHKLVTKAFKLSIKKTLRHIALQIRAL